MEYVSIHARIPLFHLHRGSNSGTLYTGFTNNIELRVWQHKNGVIEGFTKTYKCHRLLWYEKYDHVVRAINREKQIKGWRRSKKIALIESINPRWEDLAENWGKQMIFPNQPLKQCPLAISTPL